MTDVLLTGGKIDQITVIKEIENISIKEWPCPKVNNEGVTSAWSWKVAGALAVAGLNTAAAYVIADKQYQVAKNSWRIARERWDYFLNTYRPCEEKELAEACTAPVPVADYARALAVYTRAVTTSYTSADREIARLSRLYCVCPPPMMVRDMALLRSQMIGDGVSYAIRREEAIAEALDDVRWNRKIAVLNRGRGLLSESASYARASSDMYDQFGKSIGSVAESAISFVDYSMNRRPTQYPVHNAIENPLGTSQYGAMPTYAFASGSYAGVESTPLGSPAEEVGTSATSNVVVQH